MPKFYFTYGTDPAHPFRGGWTEVTASDISTACVLFLEVHPGCRKACLDGVCLYTEDKFIATDMLLNGNFGAWCQEEISINRNLIANAEGST